MKLVVAPEAAAQILVRKQWWRSNRSKAPERFDQELAAALTAISSAVPAGESSLTAPEIPDDRRACYTLLFLAGLRFGESAALRWRHYDHALKPLGRVVVGTWTRARRKPQ